MRKSVKIGAIAIALAVFVAIGTCAMYKVYMHFEYKVSALQERVESVGNSVDRFFYYTSNYPLEIDHYDFDYSWLENDEPVLIAHALGGIDGFTYTNSREALELSYEKGHRVFEADMQMIDGDVVLLHDLESTMEACGFENADFSSEEFLNSRIFDAYTPMRLADVLGFMAEHPDAYLLTDTKYDTQPYRSYIISAIVAEIMEYDPSLLDRVIVQIYNEPMLKSIMDIYPFKSVIYTLYMTPDDNERVRAFCAQSGIKAVTMSQGRCTEDFVASLEAIGIFSLVHTINDLRQAGQYIDIGVSGIYTDFLTPEELSK